MSKIKWIWQQKNYPKFKYDKSKLESLLLEVKYYQGLLNGIAQYINESDLEQTELNIFTDEALNTSAIEGEVLNRDSVRSSISKKLDIKINDISKFDDEADGLVSVLLDALNYDKEFSKQRLLGWHNSLFPTGYSGLYKINVAKYRGQESMQIVSGRIGKEKVHYEAPPRDILENEMDQFFSWINNDNDLSILKAGIAHLWFVIIHPFDDGNGRITRAITDLILARESKSSKRLYSISKAILKNKKEYYNILELTTSNTKSLDITPWLEWFLKIFLTSLKDAKKQIDLVYKKTKFWDKNRNTVLNSRQIKALNKLLDIGNKDFEGGINTRKYASLTKTSKPTASRELKDLVQKGCLVQIEGSAGRNISYEVSFGY